MTNATSRQLRKAIDDKKSKFIKRYKIDKNEKGRWSISYTMSSEQKEMVAKPIGDNKVRLVEKKGKVAEYAKEYFKQWLIANGKTIA